MPSRAMAHTAGPGRKNRLFEPIHVCGYGGRMPRRRVVAVNGRARVLRAPPEGGVAQFRRVRLVFAQ
ncbi:hypothetical protein DF3PA_50040 [Candidatus Defluviicoccus seviourii]|uniref:Uncharacterized protein n=1 Tax=Candidatus Defluviicoccus seviourii TaxID=2565273 RepID=A0A564WII6_9PROT|nr:hypothetical protein DF3PA_50040 [Candidatus Defluviicoccus seviourii]